MEDAQTSDEQRPLWRFYVYDIRSTENDPVPVTIAQVVQGAGLATRVDLSDHVESIQHTERGSDTIQGQIGGSSLTVVVDDPDLVWDPVDGSSSGYLRSGNVVRVVKGYDGIPESEWVATFTGRIVGTAGRNQVGRSAGGTLQFSCEDRLADFLKIVTTSEIFEQGTDYNFIMRRILEDDAGLTSAEFDLGSVGLQVTEQATTQFADESPLVHVARILFPLGFVPRFDGEGVLRLVSLTVDKGDDRVYADDRIFRTLSRPYVQTPPTNEVEVKGLSGTMDRIEQQRQVVATAGITMGFFTGDASIRVKFSDDASVFVNDPKLRVITSVTGALIPFGSESFDVTVVDTDPLDSGVQGALEGRIQVEGAFYAPLVVNGFAGRIAASFIPDQIAGLGAGTTISVGRIIEGIISVANSLIMSTIGRGDYEIVGAPYEYVFRELRGVARVQGTPLDQVRTVTIQNRLISSQAQADAVALRELRMARKRANPVQFTMRHDLRLVADDRFRRANERSYIISQITTTLRRGGQTNEATVSAFEVTSGVNP